MIKVRQRAKPHIFMPGQTIEAVIKLINQHDVTAAELLDLNRQYKLINGDGVPRAGTSALIPVLVRHQVAVFGVK